MDASPGTSVAVAATPMGDDAQKNTRHTKNEKAQGLARIHRTGYSFEGLDDDKLWRSTPWHKPDILRARDFYKNQLFQQGKQPMMSYADVFSVYLVQTRTTAGEAPLFSTSIRDLNSLGVGISLHFRLLKYLVCSHAVFIQF